jgi:hypothetical protein
VIHIPGCGSEPNEAGSRDYPLDGPGSRQEQASCKRYFARARKLAEADTLHYSEGREISSEMIQLAKGIMDNSTSSLNGMIPENLHPYFQEYDVKQIDLAEQADLVIQRILEFGDWEDLRWLFFTYRVKRVLLFLKQHGERWLCPPVFNYWCKLIRIRKWQKSPFPTAKAELWNL